MCHIPLLPMIVCSTISGDETQLGLVAFQISILGSKGLRDRHHRKYEDVGVGSKVSCVRFCLKKEFRPAILTRIAVSRIAFHRNNYVHVVHQGYTAVTDGNQFDRKITYIFSSIALCLGLIHCTSHHFG